MLKKSALVLSVLAIGSNLTALDYQAAGVNAAAGAALELGSGIVTNIAFSVEDGKQADSLCSYAMRRLLAKVGGKHLLPLAQVEAGYDHYWGDAGAALMRHYSNLTSLNADCAMSLVYGLLAGAGTDAGTALLSSKLDLDSDALGLVLGLLANHYARAAALKDAKNAAAVNCAYDLSNAAGALLGNMCVTPKLVK